MRNMIYLIPIISALIGWLTNWLAVKMIFRPYKKTTIFGIQGMIPKRRNDLAAKVSEVVGNSLVLREDIEKIIEKADVAPIIEARFIEIFEQKIMGKLTNVIPVIKMIPAEVINKLRDDMTNYIKIEIVGELQSKIATNIEEKELLKEIIFEKIKAFSVEKLEEIVLQISHRELKAIEYLGGLIGFIIGIVQVLLILNT